MPTKAPDIHKMHFNINFIALILCDSSLHNSNLSDRFQNLEIPQKAPGVTLRVPGKSVTFFVRKLVQSIGFRNHTRQKTTTPLSPQTISSTTHLASLYYGSRRL